MTDHFENCMPVMLRHEGGFSNHPEDPGGVTNLGVTKRNWERWVGRPVSIEDMRRLTVADVKPLYRKRYWEPVAGDQLPRGLALCVFDFSVNAGPARAARMLQEMVGANPDGAVGRKTLEALQAFVLAHGEAAAVQRYMNARRSYYRRLPTFRTFGRGWLRRCDETEASALRMIAR